MGELVRFGIAIDEDLLARFDRLVAKRGVAQNRSEAIRDLIRDALVEAEWEDSGQETIGTITLVFDHHTRDLSEKLDALQHAHHEKIVSAMHVHLDAHSCLEVLVVRGASGDIVDIAHGLIGTKGVKHGKLAMTTTGAGL
jgi:CopG family nickel-responsive transcriptional regulator